MLTDTRLRPAAPTLRYVLMDGRSVEVAWDLTRGAAWVADLFEVAPGRVLSGSLASSPAESLAAYRAQRAA